VLQRANGYGRLTDSPLVRLSRTALENLFTALQVDFVELWECLVSTGWRLELPGTDAPGIHYNLGNAGRLIIGHHRPIDLAAHTLVIAPPGEALRIEAPAHAHAATAPNVEGASWAAVGPDTARKFVAGTEDPQVLLICGYFHASFGGSVGLFASLAAPIVEQFDAGDRLDAPLRSATGELMAQEAGMGAMTTALMKQVLVMLLRRSLSSMNLWVERFSILGDPPIARAFAEMVARPGAPHSVLTLARTAALSRSSFMSRFTAVFERSPMVVLRKLRMRQAAVLLRAGDLSIDSVMREVGYASRSSFLRAFRDAYGSDPSTYRASNLDRVTPS
jgi:AraC family transcriptional regulator, activator of mtrCDE